MDAGGTGSLRNAVPRQEIVIDRRFHGPPESGHGGYTCGLLAREIDGAGQNIDQRNEKSVADDDSLTRAPR